MGGVLKCPVCNKEDVICTDEPGFHQHTCNDCGYQATFLNQPWKRKSSNNKEDQ